MVLFCSLYYLLILQKKELIYGQSLSRQCQHFSFYLVQNPGVNVASSKTILFPAPAPAADSQLRVGRKREFCLGLCFRHQGEPIPGILVIQLTTALCYLYMQNVSVNDRNALALLIVCHQNNYFVIVIFREQKQLSSWNESLKDT